MEKTKHLQVRKAKDGYEIRLNGYVFAQTSYDKAIDRYVLKTGEKVLKFALTYNLVVALHALAEKICGRPCRLTGEKLAF